MIKAYKTKLKLNNKERGYFNGCAGLSRFVYNWALADRKQTYELTKKPGSMYEQKKRFNALKKSEYPWMYDYPYVILESAFGDLDIAYKNFFRRLKKGEKPGFPKFKNRFGKKSFRLRGSIHVTHAHIKLPKIGWVRLAESGYIPTEGVKILYATVSEKGANWFVSVTVEQDDHEPIPTKNISLGVDLGVKNAAVFSNGKVFDKVAPLRKAERKLDRLNRELSRRVERSANWHKTKKKIAKLHIKISNIRKHTQHEISAYATKAVTPRRIVIEDLNVRGMQAKPQPKPNGNGGFSANGRAAKSGLAKSVADTGLGEIARQIEYKAGWLGIELVKADRWYPSTQTCSECGHRHTGDDKLTLRDRIFTCVACGIVLDRDLNAAINLAQYEPVKGGELPVELETLVSTVKQEVSGDLVVAGI